MGFYSFVVFNDSGEVVSLPEHFLILDTGQNAFNIQLNETEPFLCKLGEADVRVEKMNRLDEHEQLEPPKLEE